MKKQVPSVEEKVNEHLDKTCEALEAMKFPRKPVSRFQAFCPVTEADWKSANYLQRAGSICADPCWLIDVYVMTKEKKSLIERYGALGASDGIDPSVMDYALHRALGVTLSDADSVHLEKNIIVVVHAKKEKVWQNPQDGWETAIVIRNASNKWNLIPIA